MCRGFTPRPVPQEETLTTTTTTTTTTMMMMVVGGRGSCLGSLPHVLKTYACLLFAKQKRQQPHRRQAPCLPFKVFGEEILCRTFIGPYVWELPDPGKDALNSDNTHRNTYRNTHTERQHRNTHTHKEESTRKCCTYSQQPTLQKPTLQQTTL